MFAAISLAIVVFTGTVLLLVGVILLARKSLVASGEVQLAINGERTLAVPVGGKLLQTLAAEDIFLSSACGGGGTCAQCKCVVEAGGGEMTPTERGYFTRREEREGWRLSCQTPVRQDMQIRIPESVFGVRRWTCTVVANDNVATFIKELTLAMPPEDVMSFRAGSYMQIECPPHEQAYADIDIAPEYRGDWDRLNLWRFVSRVPETTIRAYSMANYPEEKGLIKFNIRIATPPPPAPSAPQGAADVAPGAMSSWVFGRKPGDTMILYGPFGDFHARDSDAEMIYIGGGAGMAPLRSHIFDLLKRRHSQRRISYWYGARSLREAFYVDEFEELERDNPNFSWQLALSDPQPEDNWQGRVGFIHEVLLREYLDQHPAPEDCEYYLCGPPMMNMAVIAMLTELGVARENILLDDFGG